MSVLVQELVNAGIYHDINTVIKEAVRVLWQERSNVRIEFAAEALAEVEALQ